MTPLRLLRGPTMRGFFLTLLPGLSLSLLINLRDGVHFQFAITVWRLEVSSGLGYWERT